jgi:hypothetical protein
MQKKIALLRNMGRLPMPHELKIGRFHDGGEGARSCVKVDVLMKSGHNASL